MAKILVVDDRPDMARLMTWAVEQQGYESLTARDGQQGLAMAMTERPDVILLDIMMPGMDGLEVLRRLKADSQLRHIPVILVTAKEEDADVIAGLDAGAQDYITKPFKREILAARVRSAVRIKEHHDSLLKLTKQLEKEIAERERTQMELAQVHKLEAIGHLAAGIAHEINTPAQYVGDNTRFLQEIFGDVDTLLGDLGRMLEAAKRGRIDDKLVEEVDATVRKAEVEYIRTEAPRAIQQSLEGIERVACIVKAMKEFAHPGSGHRQFLDLNRAIESTLTVSRNEWKYVAEVVTDFAEDLPPVFCMAGDINQVVLNLVVNAAQAIANVVKDGSHGKGTIAVRTRRDGDCVEIRIEDTGTGIPAAIRDKVFDQFFTTKDVGEGTGMGLAIARSIVVKKHGGTIWFETEEGKGTVFFVRLPIACQTGSPQEPQLQSAELAL